MRYAEVALNGPIDRTFTYHVPAGLESRLVAGCLVRVEFGVAMRPGVVVGFRDESGIPATKPIIELLDGEAVLDAGGIALARWIGERFFGPIGACVWLLLPPGFTGKSDWLYRFVRDGGEEEEGPAQMALPGAGAKVDGPLESRALEYLRRRGPKRLQQMKRTFRREPIAGVLSRLEEGGLVARESVLSPPAARAKMAVRVHAKFSGEEIGSVLGRLGKGGKHGGYRGILEYVVGAESAPTRGEVMAETGGSAWQVKRLEREGLVELREEQVWRDSLGDMDFVAGDAPRLMPDQQAVWEEIRSAAAGGGGRFLLHGVTGSGKTEIYLRAIAEVLERGRRAILLTPEIALTPQTARRVWERFPGRVAIAHGSLPIGERYDVWQRARRGEIDVVVGTRSALFSPLRDVGLVVLDEEHDASYKQGPGRGRAQYHAREVAEYMMGRAGGILILGSATPDVVSWHRAEKGHYRYLRLPKRIMGHRRRIEGQAERAGVATRYGAGDYEALHIGLPPVEVVDMRAELRSGNSSMFSRALREGLGAVLERGEQAMLLLNRRGQATYVFCRDCGHALECGRCDSPMTYHRFDSVLRCHHCGASMEQPRVCPVCQSGKIRYFGAGTQQVEEVVQGLFPGARTLRWDADTASKGRRHFEILRGFVDGEADVLIGTQMIAKGLDLPLVTLVGVVSADLGLSLPDYRAGERVFQLLSQVAGRAGRGILGGSVILQTYQPESYVVKAAAGHDYAGFVEAEMAYRRAMGYPPFRELARIVFAYTDALKAEKQAEVCARRVAALMGDGDGGASLIGPAPCYFRRVDRHYRWQLLLRGVGLGELLRRLPMESGWQVDLGPIDLL